MSTPPFIALCDDTSSRDILSVPPGHEGFVRHAGGRLHLRPGMHRLQCERVAAVFLVCVEGSHGVDLRSLGGAMLRAANGRWSPIKLLGRLVYGVVRPEPLVDFLEREQIHEPRQLERELGTIEKGRLADLVVVNGSPLTDVTVLLDPARIELVLKSGAVCADRRKPVAS